jgi:hypothetical protein
MRARVLYTVVERVYERSMAFNGKWESTVPMICCIRKAATRYCLSGCEASSPLKPFAIHVSPFPTDVCLECTLEHSSPVQVTLVFGYFLRGFLSGMSIVRRNFVVETCNTFSLGKLRTKVREVSGGIKWFPPMNRERKREAFTVGRLPEVVEVIRVCASEESLESECLRGGAILWGSIEKIREPNQNYKGY